MIRWLPRGLSLIQWPTRNFLRFLREHPHVRSQIRAKTDKTLLYAGKFFEAAWIEIRDQRKTVPQMADKEILPDVLRRVAVSGQQFSNLHDWIKSLEILVPKDKNSFIAWRAVSGIFAANAEGAVSFYIGTGITKDKVFAASEVAVLSRNPNLDSLTREVLAYYQDALRTRKVDIGGIADIGFGFIRD
jgi:hypothetical protein